MMQEIQVGAKSIGQRSMVSSQSFAVLLALARKPLTDGQLRATIGMSPIESGLLLDRLRRNLLVSAVSESEEGGVKLTLCLTDEGERVLLRQMEQMYELPEK
ncbi:MAG: hypothetical protein ACLQEQ_05895 [Nitrososphaerales archaeon]